MAAHTPTFNILSLCAGIGGLDLGLRLAVSNSRTVCYVERETFAAAILAQKAKDGWLDDAPVWSDVKTFNSEPWRGIVDCIIGGYPCQPFSFAGKRQGKDDSRNLWPDIARIVDEIKPAWCFFENVPGHLSMGFDNVARDLQKMGYTVAAGIFSAAEVGSTQKRDRLFILAHAKGQHSQRMFKARLEETPATRAGYKLVRPSCSLLAHTSCGRQESQPKRNYSKQSERSSGGASTSLANTRPQPLQGAFDAGSGSGQPQETSARLGCFPPPINGNWESVPVELKPAIHRMADGSAHRMDRISAIGNAVCPLAAANAFTTLTHAIDA